MKPVDYLSKCRRMLQEVLEKLNAEIDHQQIDEITEIIVKSMESHFRYFHTFDHVLMVTQSDDPLIVLAGLFHDIVYTQVDTQIKLEVIPYLIPFLEDRKQEVFLKNNIEAYEKELAITLEIFGLKKGDNLSKFGGINEFLSALSAMIILSDHLPLKTLARMVTIIELTIPFRKIQADQLTIPQRLQQKLESANVNFQLGLTSEEIVTTITQAVELVNLDVSGFGLAKVEDFINNTWLLLPEANHCLISLEKSTVKEYCTALAKTGKFLDFLDPEIIFHRYNNQPNWQDWQDLLGRGEHNLAVGRLYLCSIVVSLSIIDALCSRFCHHISLSFLFGFSPSLSSNFHSIVYFLPKKRGKFKAQSDLEEKVLCLIQCQPKPDFFSRLQYSVLVDFVVSYLGFSQLTQLLPQYHLFLDEKIDHEEYLGHFPPEIVNLLANSIASLLEEKQKNLLTSLPQQIEARG